MKRLLFYCGGLWMTSMVSLSVRAEMPTKIPPDKERGEELYRELCVGCHGPKALGNGVTATRLGYDAEQMRLAGRIQKNEMDAAIVLIQMGKGLMPAYEQQIDRHESKRILIWLADLDPLKGAELPEENSKVEKAKAEDEAETVNDQDAPVEEEVEPIDPQEEEE